MRRTSAGSRRPDLGRIAPVVLVGALALGSACSNADEPAAEAAAPTTAAPATTAAAGTTTTTTTTSTTAAPSTTTTTTPPTTTTEPAPSSTTTTAVVTTTTTTEAPRQSTEPIAPPTDSYASEPVIEAGKISIPKIGVDMTMYEGIRMTTLDYGPGHWPGTANPGEIGNVVIGGHRTSKHRVFRDVDQLAPGDEIVLHDADGNPFTYAVSSVEVVEPTDVWIVNPTETATATLFACHPPGSTAQRIVVFADLVGG